MENCEAYKNGFWSMIGTLIVLMLIYFFAGEKKQVQHLDAGGNPDGTLYDDDGNATDSPDGMDYDTWVAHHMAAGDADDDGGNSYQQEQQAPEQQQDDGTFDASAPGASEENGSSDGSGGGSGGSSGGGYFTPAPIYPVLPTPIRLFTVKGTTLPIITGTMSGLHFNAGAGSGSTTPPFNTSGGTTTNPLYQQASNSGSQGGSLNTGKMQNKQVAKVAARMSSMGRKRR